MAKDTIKVSVDLETLLAVVLFERNPADGDRVVAKSSAAASASPR